MSETKSVLLKKFLLDKKSITLEDCMMYVETYKPEDKSWFYHYCVDEVPVLDDKKQPVMVKDEDGNEVAKKEVRPFLIIKKEFYKRYFPASGELSKRMKLFADWDVE